MASFSGVQAQIIPASVANSKDVVWGALGVNQQYARRWNSVVFIGASRQSTLGTLDAFTNFGILVLNQETGYRLTDRLTLQYGTSYRLQGNYQNTAPYAKGSPPARREVRNLLQGVYRFALGQVMMQACLRPEYRLFYTPSWHDWPNVRKQFRVASRLQATIPFSKNTAGVALVVINDVLAASNKLAKSNPNANRHWQRFRFTEDWLAAFIRIPVKNTSLFLDPGCMNQLWLDQKRKARYTAYLSLDAVWVNPFTRKK